MWRPDGANDFVQDAARPSGGEWQKPVNLSATNSDEDPQLAVDAQGNAVALWRHEGPGSTFSIQGAARPAGREWTAPVTVSGAGAEATEPDLAIGEQGNAVAVWRSRGTTEVIQGAVRPAGREWQKPANLSASGEEALEPKVAVAAQGNAIAIWCRGHGTSFIVQAARAVTP